MATSGWRATARRSSSRRRAGPRVAPRAPSAASVALESPAESRREHLPVHAIRLSFVAAIAAVTVGCASLPPPEPRTPTTALTGTQNTRLGRALAPVVSANAGRTGIHTLVQPRDAFAVRVALAAAADRSI